MLTVKASVGVSDIDGLGLISDQRIRAGEIVWQFHPLDQRVHRDFLLGLPPEAREKIMHYCYINPEAPEHVVLCFDDARFMNFNDPANTRLGGVVRGEFVLVASREIQPGEEITVPMESDADAQRKLRDALFD